MKIKKIFPVEGMTCASCAARVERSLNALPGVDEANINFATGRAQVVFNPAVNSESDLHNAVKNAGYELRLEEGKRGQATSDKAQAAKYRQLKRQALGALALAVPIAVIGMFFHDVPALQYLAWALSTVVIAVFGRRFYTGAWRQLRHGSANMDTLVATSTGIAYLFSLFNLLFPGFWLSRGVTPHLYFEAASVIIAFILVGRLLEERAMRNTSAAIRKLAALQPGTVTVATGTVERTIPVETARIGDTIVVRPGERIALDGTVTAGDSYVDQSMLSGEPLAVHKHPGEKVYAGTINQRGAFRFRADKTGSDTMLAQIIRMVQDAQGSKAPVQRLVDRIAGIFVPIIIGIAVLSFALWLALAPADGFSHGILAMVTVLIIACPCALGLATPTALIVGIGKGAENGILIKDAASLEIARKIDTIVLDKTGTITEGRPTVVDALWSAGSESTRKILYSLERLSEHPLAEAVVRACDGQAFVPIEGFEAIPGRGVKGIAEGETYYAGTAGLLADNGVRLGGKLRQQAGEWLTEAKTVIWFGNSSEALAVIAITDRIKETSPEAVSRLRQMGLSVYMLTGDNAATAAAIARMAGIDRYEAEVLPANKALFVQRLQHEGRRVAMIGDGINDSAALAQADLGIAMGRGSDIAMETAMITILTSDLMKIPEAVQLSRMTVKTIRENLFWASVYNLVSVPIAAGILFPVCGFLLDPMIAGAAMALSSVSVVGNSLRLKRRKISRSGDFRTAQPEFAIQNGYTENKIPMKKRFVVEGMACGHCRAHVEDALNGIPGVKAVVTLDPPAAEVEFTDQKIALDELQRTVTEKAGAYRLHE